METETLKSLQALGGGGGGSREEKEEEGLE
jgi:hypothetical protein